MVQQIFSLKEWSYFKVIPTLKTAKGVEPVSTTPIEIEMNTVDVPDATPLPSEKSAPVKEEEVKQVFENQIGTGKIFIIEWKTKLLFLSSTFLLLLCSNVYVDSLFFIYRLVLNDPFRVIQESCFFLCMNIVQQITSHIVLLHINYKLFTSHALVHSITLIQWICIVLSSFLGMTTQIVIQGVTHQAQFTTFHSVSLWCNAIGSALLSGFSLYMVCFEMIPSYIFHHDLSLKTKVLYAIMFALSWFIFAGVMTLEIL